LSEASLCPCLFQKQNVPESKSPLILLIFYTNSKKFSMRIFEKKKGKGTSYPQNVDKVWITMGICLNYVDFEKDKK
jgi:hypothetical protein